MKTQQDKQAFIGCLALCLIFLTGALTALLIEHGSIIFK